MLTFRADCSSCCGLCCVVPDQLAVQGFPIDKPAESPCRHLDCLHRCSIHAVRSMKGYSACEGFDCFGAGQWITQTLFGGAHWTGSPSIARQMFAAYRHWLPRFEAAALLAEALPLVREDAKTIIQSRIKELTSISTAGTPGRTSAIQLRRETLALIHSALLQ